MAPISLFQQAVPTLVVVMALVQDVTFAASVPGQFNPEVLRNMPLTGLTNSQTVYWSVQAVDTAFAGGPFATESSVASLPALTTDRGDGTNAIVSWTPPTQGWTLQERTDLSDGGWSDSPSGEANPVTVDSAGGTTFCRLRSP